VDKNGTFSVKNIAEKWTKRDVTIIYAHGQQQGKHYACKPTARSVVVHVVHGQRKQHHENAEVIGPLTSGFQNDIHNMYHPILAFGEGLEASQYFISPNILPIPTFALPLQRISK
jgi:hypothetical protein